MHELHEVSHMLRQALARKHRTCLDALLRRAVFVQVLIGRHQGLKPRARLLATVDLLRHLTAQLSAKNCSQEV